MKIAFTGCSGTGKTTLAKIVSQIYGIPYNPIGARSVAAEMGLETPYEADRLGIRAEFQERLLRSKYEWECQHESFVTDRTGWDQHCYARLALPDYHFSAAYFDTVQKTDRKYDVIFFTPRKVFQDLGNDPARKDDPEYHLEFEVLLGASFGSRTIWLSETSVPERIHTILEVLEDQCGF